MTGSQFPTRLSFPRLCTAVSLDVAQKLKSTNCRIGAAWLWADPSHSTGPAAGDADVDMTQNVWGCVVCVAPALSWNKVEIHPGMP